MKSHKDVICPFMSGPYAQADSVHVLEVGPGTLHAKCVGPECAAFADIPEAEKRSGRCCLIPKAPALLY